MAGAVAPSTTATAVMAITASVAASTVAVAAARSTSAATATAGATATVSAAFRPRLPPRPAPPWSTMPLRPQAVRPETPRPQPLWRPTISAAKAVATGPRTRPPLSRPSLPRWPLQNHRRDVHGNVSGALGLRLHIGRSSSSSSLHVDRGAWRRRLSPSRWQRRHGLRLRIGGGRGRRWHPRRHPRRHPGSGSGSSLRIPIGDSGLLRDGGSDGRLHVRKRRRRRVTVATAMTAPGCAGGGGSLLESAGRANSTAAILLHCNGDAPRPSLPRRRTHRQAVAALDVAPWSRPAGVCLGSGRWQWAQQFVLFLRTYGPIVSCSDTLIIIR